MSCGDQDYRLGVGGAYYPAGCRLPGDVFLPFIPKEGKMSNESKDYDRPEPGAYTEPNFVHPVDPVHRALHGLRAAIEFADREQLSSAKRRRLREALIQSDLSPALELLNNRRLIAQLEERINNQGSCIKSYQGHIREQDDTIRTLREQIANLQQSLRFNSPPYVRPGACKPRC